jgi:hypothetical protein
MIRHVEQADITQGHSWSRNCTVGAQIRRPPSMNCCGRDGPVAYTALLGGTGNEYFCPWRSKQCRNIPNAPPMTSWLCNVLYGRCVRRDMRPSRVDHERVCLAPASRPIRQLDRSSLLCQLPTYGEPPNHRSQTFANRAWMTAHAPWRSLGSRRRPHENGK